MTDIPANPKIYHITHVDNLASVMHAGCIWSDAKRLEMELNTQVVGMSNIKERRLRHLTVMCHPGTKVGEYVPFYFCPRSVMLYTLYMRNHPELSYRGGQGPIVHLQADLRATVAWAEANGSRWAFSDGNAGAVYAQFFNDLNSLGQINWSAVRANDFRDAAIKEGKQAEFLIYERFPWELVEEVGVLRPDVLGQVRGVLREAEHQPLAKREPLWYY